MPYKSNIYIHTENMNVLSLSYMVKYVEAHVTKIHQCLYNQDAKDPPENVINVFCRHTQFKMYYFIIKKIVDQTFMSNIGKIEVFHILRERAFS